MAIQSWNMTLEKLLLLTSLSTFWLAHHRDSYPYFVRVRGEGEEGTVLGTQG